MMSRQISSLTVLLLALIFGLTACTQDTPPRGPSSLIIDVIQGAPDIPVVPADTLPNDDAALVPDSGAPPQDIPPPPEETTEETTEEDVFETVEDIQDAQEEDVVAGVPDDVTEDAGADGTGDVGEETTEDVAESPPDGIEDTSAACITPDAGAWVLTGEEYCASLGLYCTWVDYYGSDDGCDGAPYSGCWSATALSCCKTPMSGHAGSPAGVSALWHCGEVCPEGSELVDGQCLDIDECALPDPVCGDNATCTNTVGAYQCLCDEGYTGDGQDCELANPYYPECITSGDEAWKLSGEAYCADFDLQCTGVDYFGSDDACGGDPYSGCWSATALSCCKTPMSGHAGFPGGASATWYCGKDCPEGSDLVDGQCLDIDECALPDPVCGDNATCTNQVGTYKCTCDLGYTGDGQTCEPVQNTPGCITSGDAAWSVSGNAYCQSFGMTCTGTAYYGSSPSCEGDPYTGCWGGTAASCCASPMSGHAGSPESASALWTCAP